MKFDVTEIAAVVAATAAGAWAVLRSALNARDKLESRIDQLERDSITRAEFERFAEMMRHEHREMRTHLDHKLDLINAQLMSIVANQNQSAQNSTQQNQT